MARQPKVWTPDFKIKQPSKTRFVKRRPAAIKKTPQKVRAPAAHEIASESENAEIDSLPAIDFSPSIPFHSRFQVSGGARFASTYFFPSLHIEYAVVEKYSLGVLPFVGGKSTDGGFESQVFGVLVTANYFNRSYFKGLWLQGGVGYLSVSHTSATDSESSASVIVTGTAGYRERLLPHLTLGVAGGFQFARRVANRMVDSGVADLRPTILLDLGYQF